MKRRRVKVSDCEKIPLTQIRRNQNRVQYGDGNDLIQLDVWFFFLLLLFERSLGRRGRFSQRGSPHSPLHLQVWKFYSKLWWDLLAALHLFAISAGSAVIRGKETYRVANIFQTKLICPDFRVSLSLFLFPPRPKSSFSLRFFAV